jgi:UDP-galactopyranose mutase
MDKERGAAEKLHKLAAHHKERTLICFSHLRWRFVYQRPQHLMTRFAQAMRVFYVEEPIVSEDLEPRLDVSETSSDVKVVAPRLPEALDEGQRIRAQRQLLDRLCQEHHIVQPILWYYTPMSGVFSDHLEAETVVYDCMDELAAFRGAPPTLLENEQKLFGRADLVFTGGHSLYRAKKWQHPNVHAFPSSVDVAHFRRARSISVEPPDQASIPHPRLGFYGVLDERLDTALLDELSRNRPDWHFVMIGPVVKIAPEDLPARDNIHYLGSKEYDDLPAYVAGWDVALLLFALNEATRFISPTKTPEYLAASKPVVSTPITDVVDGYGNNGLVEIAASPAEFEAKIEANLSAATDRSAWLQQVDAQLQTMSWDATWVQMMGLIDNVRREAPSSRRSGNRAALRRERPRQAAPFIASRAGFDYLIVGAGFAGSVLAERLAADAGKRVLIVDRRPHIGGNAFDRHNDDGILVHRYGPHIFHTNAPKVAQYLSRFTRWRPYEHRVRASVDGRLVPIPINLTTINSLYGLNLDSSGVEAFFAGRAEPVENIRTSEDVVISRIGRDLYEMFFRPYTRKQWGIDPSELDKAVTGRVPTRTNADDRYFTDEFQNMPLHGFTRMFENMLDHAGIKILLNTDHREIAREVQYDTLIYTGPIDEFFDFRFGKLPYRSLQFRHETIDQEWFQPVAVVNYPSEGIPHTRITEYKHLTGQRHSKTSISYEYPCGEGDPYYPVPQAENALLYKRYQALADQTPGVEFAGRLGTYRYYNMDQVVAQALALYERIRPRTRSPAQSAELDEPALTRFDGNRSAGSALKQRSETADATG